MPPDFYPKPSSDGKFKFVAGQCVLDWCFTEPASVSSGFRGKIQNLIDLLLERDQIPCNEFIAGACELVRKANLENFGQAFVGIKTHAIAIGNGNENEIKKFL